MAFEKINIEKSRKMNRGYITISKGENQIMFPVALREWFESIRSRANRDLMFDIEYDKDTDMYRFNFNVDGSQRVNRYVHPKTGETMFRFFTLYAVKRIANKGHKFEYKTEDSITGDLNNSFYLYLLPVEEHENNQIAHVLEPTSKIAWYNFATKCCDKDLDIKRPAKYYAEVIIDFFENNDYSAEDVNDAIERQQVRELSYGLTDSDNAEEQACAIFDFLMRCQYAGKS